MSRAEEGPDLRNGLKEAVEEKKTKRKENFNYEQRGIFKDY